jgi:chromosome segregation ATPase
MQYDLLELRDAHAKLRTTNEKFRRERERLEKEREELRQVSSTKRRQEADEERKVNAMLDQVEELMRLVPDIFPAKSETSGSSLALPSAPIRTRVLNFNSIIKSPHF